MPILCPHCHKLVAEQVACAACGKPLPIKMADDARGLPSGDLRILVLESFKIIGPVFVVGAICLVAIYFLLG